MAADFEALQRRLVSRKGTAVSFVAFDLLALEGDDLRSKPLARRREVLEETLRTGPVLAITIQTDDHNVARRWLDLREIPALEGVVAKRADQPYQPGKRSWIKVKRYETADLVVAGYVGDPESPSSLLLGAYDETGQLKFVGATRSPKQGWGIAMKTPRFPEYPRRAVRPSGNTSRPELQAALARMKRILPVGMGPHLPAGESQRSTCIHRR